MDYLHDAQTGSFDYIVLFQQMPEGTKVEESRKPKRGSTYKPFLPKMLA
jgi:hypothetical protein